MGPHDHSVPCACGILLRVSLTIGIDREDDGRWLAEVSALPGVLVYSDTREGAVAAAEALALRVAADRLEHGETVPAAVLALFSAAA
jgi:predicted RNase H-like HicB family nuclease